MFSSCAQRVVHDSGRQALATVLPGTRVPPFLCSLQSKQTEYDRSDQASFIGTVQKVHVRTSLVIGANGAAHKCLRVVARRIVKGNSFACNWVGAGQLLPGADVRP